MTIWASDVQYGSLLNCVGTGYPYSVITLTHVAALRYLESEVKNVYHKSMHFTVNYPKTFY